MSTAVLFATAPATDGGPAAALPYHAITPLRRLVDQLAALGVPKLHVITRPRFVQAIEPLIDGPEPVVHLHACANRTDDLRAVAALAREARGGGIALAYADVVTRREALAALVAERATSTAIMASSRPPDGGGAWFRIRTPRTRVLSAASPYHWVGAPNGYFLGLLRVGAGDEEALASAADRLARVVEHPPDAWQRELDRKVRADALDPALAAEEVPALLVTALVRGGTPVRMHDVRKLTWARPLSEVDSTRLGGAIREKDEERALLDSAVKAADGFFTTFFVSPYSKYIARWAARHGVTPNQVTIFAMGVGLLAAAAFATGERWGLIAGAVLLQAAFTFDCVDGQLARYTRQFSRFGAWLDSVFDRAKEYVVYAGLAIGSVRGFGVDVWTLAGAALALQTARHMIEFAYWDVHHAALDKVPQPPLEQPGDRSGPPPGEKAEPPRGIAARTLALSRALDRAHWIKKIAVFPIGERFAAISVAAAVSTPRTTFIVLLVWGGFAAAYSFAAHVMHSILRPVFERGGLAAFRDDGPLARAVIRRLPRRGPGRFDWAIPGLLRALEYGLLLVTAVLAHGPATRACFALLAVLAFHHYDTVYRLRQRGTAPPEWVTLAAGGWDGRIVLAWIALLVAVTTVGMAAAAGLLAVLFVGESAASWLGTSDDAQTPTEDELE